MGDDTRRPHETLHARIMTALLLLIVVTMPTQKTLRGPITPSDVALALALGYLAIAMALRRLGKWTDVPQLILPPAPFVMVLVVVALSCIRVIGGIPEERASLLAELEELGMLDQADAQLADLNAEMSARIKVLVKESAQFIEFFLIAPLVLLNALRTRRAALQASVVWTTMAGLIALYGVAQAFGESDPLAVTTLFGSRMVHGAFLAISLPLVWARGMAGSTIAMRVGLCAVAVLGLLALPTFGAFWAAAAGLLAASLALPGKASARTGRLVACVVALVAVGLWAPHADQFGKSAVALRTVREGSGGELEVSKQYAEWQAANELMVDPHGDRVLGSNFVLGLGPGQYQDVISQFGGFLDVGKVETDSQNQYFVLGCTLGFSGILALAVLLGASLRSAGRALCDTSKDAELSPVIAGLVGCLVALVVVSFYTTPIVRGVGVTVMLIVCMALAASRITADDTEAS